MKYKHGYPLGYINVMSDGVSIRLKVLPSGLKKFWCLEKDSPPEEEEDHGSVLPDPKPKRPRGL